MGSIDRVLQFFSCRKVRRFGVSASLSFLIMALAPAAIEAEEMSVARSLDRASGLILHAGCRDVLGHARLATLDENLSGELSGEELGQQIIKDVVTVFIASYAHGRKLPYQSAAREIEELCLANPTTPLVRLETPELSK